MSGSRRHEAVSRRRLVRDVLGLAVGSLASRALAEPAAALEVRPTGSAPIPVPADFMGLGYEMSSVATPGLLRAANERYVQLIRLLGPAGVLRVGGIVADYTRYQPESPSVAEPKRTVITREDLAGFRAFLDRVGWTAIWSLNFAQGTLPEAVEEAIAVHSALGPRLQAFELGNEVENYGKGGNRFRPSPYTYGQYRAEYTRWRAEIVKAIPAARFAAPDTAGSVEWVERIARDAHGEVQLLTTHYYRNEQRHGSAEQLLEPDPGLAHNLQRLVGAARASGLPWRMCETNSFSGGGLPGVSDSFLGALWTLDFLLLLAAHAAAGVNLETGVNQLGFVSSYSPIQDDGQGTNSPGAPFYGLLAFREAMRGNTHLHPITVIAAPTSVTAYGLGSATRVRSLVVVNRGSSPFELRLGSLRIGPAGVLRLEAPAVDSVSGIMLGGAPVSPEGKWAPRPTERVRGDIVQVAATSAAVVHPLAGAGRLHEATRASA